MNVRLLRKIQKAIVKAPTKYDQDVTISCGTTHCIAGWALVLDGQDPMKLGGRLSRAGEALELDCDERGRLFERPEYMWPEKYATAYRKAKTPRGRARIAYNRISHFIKTKGAE
jgi:hypothetical protein